MQNLPSSYRQKDKELYQSVTSAGVLHYENLYMSGQAVDEKSKVRGIPADDFNVFATLVFALYDRRTDFKKLRSKGQLIRHIDSGTGPNLYTFIASLPYADEQISIDITPANVQRLKAAADQTQPLAPHWKSWLEIAAILYDMGSAEALIRLDRENPRAYDRLRHYPNLSDIERQELYHTILEQVDVKARRDNPYRHLNLEAELIKRLKPHIGDILDDVAPLKELVGTADIYTRVFFSESIDDSIAVVAHAEVNGIQFAKEGAFSLSAHMSKTTGYKGFFTPEELAVTPTRRLAELPATAAFFEALLGALVHLTGRYRALWETLEDGPEERKMVRQGMTYSGAVILCGEAAYKNPDGSNKYETGLELIQDLNSVLRIVSIGESQRMHCTVHDIGDVLNELSAPHFSTGGQELVVRILSPSRPS